MSACLIALLVAACQGADVPTRVASLDSLPEKPDTLPAPPPPPPGAQRYTAIDLGTLGGDASEPTAIREDGAVVGRSTLTDGSLRPFVWENGVIRELPTRSQLPGGRAAAFGGNLIAGEVEDGMIALWEDGLLRAVIPAGHETRVVGANARGEALAWTSSDAYHDFRALLVTAAGAVDLGTFPGGVEYTMPTALNDRGQVVGYADPLERGDADRGAMVHPFLWDNGVMRDLGTLGTYPCGATTGIDSGVCSSGVAWDINAGGVVVGQSSVRHLTRPFIWEAGALRDLGAFPGRHARAALVNDSGVVAGEVGDHPNEAAFLWRNGVTTTLPSFGGYTRIAVMNNAGIVAGTARNAQGRDRAVVWENDTITELDALDGYATAVVAMNERGDIVGWRVLAGGVRRGILWRRAP